jgi:hypothetical protein
VAFGASGLAFLLTIGVIFVVLVARILNCLGSITLKNLDFQIGWIDDGWDVVSTKLYLLWIFLKDMVNCATTGWA